MKRYVPTSLDDFLDSEEALDIADPRYVQMQAAAEKIEELLNKVERAIQGIGPAMQSALDNPLIPDDLKAVTTRERPRQRLAVNSNLSEDERADRGHGPHGSRFG